MSPLSNNPPKLILASGSVQRKKLLKMLGVPFVVRRSGVEELQKIQTTCSKLVKDNALLKARDIASKNKNAVIIGADTVVYVGNKQIIGKPKDYADARRILRQLFSRPQWVYTGLTVIDTRSGREIVDYEKTRVFMIHLSDDEIDRYHQKVDPFDKAGGFDIEGWGSIFIHRIEGCYSNVIGLPMAKLAGMLKKVGVSILSLFLMVSLAGCHSEFNLATEQEERSMYTTDHEEKIGLKVAQSIEKNYKINTNVDINKRVQDILDRIVEVCDRHDIVYFIKVIDEDLVNAVSLPGGYIYVFQGLVDEVENDDQLAGVIAHEVGHITARHGVKRLQASYGALLLQLAAIEAGPAMGAGVRLAMNSLFTEYSQRDEFESDELGIKYMTDAGYDPYEMLKVLDILQEQQDRAEAREFSYWRTHPFIIQRKAVVKKEIEGELDFRGWVNLIGANPE